MGKLRRISLRDGKFNTEGRVLDADVMDAIVVNAAGVSRAYYGETYDPNKIAAPTCWSSDVQRPDQNVPQDKRQASRCMDCPQNVRGSGQFGGRACRFSQRLALVFGDNPKEVYQLQVPATSIFGTSRGGDSGLQDYARLLAKHDTDIATITTRIYFDRASVVPKLYFKPLASLDEATYAAVSRMVDHEDTIEAITSTVPITSEPVSPFTVVEGFELNAN